MTPQGVTGAPAPERGCSRIADLSTQPAIDGGHHRSRARRPPRKVARPLGKTVPFVALGVTVLLVLVLLSWVISTYNRLVRLRT